MPQEKYFIGISDYQTVRRNILECSKSMIYFLRRVSGGTSVRAQKKQKLKELRGHMKELSLLFAKLRDYMPQNSQEDAKRRPDSAEGKKQRFSPSATEVELDNLERELSDIERKLSTLKR
jgi:hypothetical protein